MELKKFSEVIAECDKGIDSFKEDGSIYERDIKYLTDYKIEAQHILYLSEMQEEDARKKTAGEWFDLGRKATDLYEKSQYYDKALKLVPKNDTAWYCNGWALENLGAHKGAIKCYDEAIKLDPKNDTAWNLKGWTLDNLDKQEEAIKCYDKALEINPKYDTAWNNKGLALDNLGRYEEAIECYNEAIRLDPKYDNARNNKSLALKKLAK